MLRRLLPLLCCLSVAVAIDPSDIIAVPDHEPLPLRHGTQDLGGKATLALPAGYGFLATAEANHLLEQVWGNPHQDDLLGVIVPDGFDPLARDAWAVVVSYEASGHVADGDAKDLDYDDLLAQMQKATRAGNPAREKAGYSTIDLLGWAEAPHYDPETHKLYWAKRLRFGGSDGETLNYCVRVLGRGGVLEFNAVAEPSQLALVGEASKEMLAATDFVPGQRYADYVDGDHTAAYGVGGLIAGGVLLKSGLLKLLLKPLLIGGGILVAAVSKLRARRKAKAADAGPALADR